MRGRYEARERGHETYSKAIAIRGICGGGHAALGRAGSVEKRDKTNPYASHSIVVGDHYV